MAGKKGMKHYPQSVKYLAVRMHLDERKSTREIMQALGIVDERRVRKWAEIYRKYGTVDMPFAKPKGRPRKFPRTVQQQMEYDLTRLRMENELLRTFLYEATRR